MAEPAGQQSTTSLSWRVRVCRASWKGLLFVWGTLILGILINVGSSWLITKNFDTGGTPLGWGVDHPWVMLPLLFLLVVLTLLSGLGSHEKQAELARPLSKQDRDHILKRLRRYYEQILSQSLQGAVQVELGLAERPAAVQNALSLSLHLPNQSEQLLPHTSIIQAYELAQCELLILGEPGAGKSTLLLELAHHLVVLAEQDATQSLPVLLPLSSWATKHPPLRDWLVEQVALLYNIPEGLSQQWLQGKQLLPLLDGLDEVEASQRAACIAAINTYHHEHLQSLVVCSRTSEYEAAATQKQLTLHSAVVVQPLSQEQVDVYLEHLGKPLAVLRAAMRENVALRELVTTPLMLQVLILTYYGTLIRGFSHMEDLLRKQIWNDYVQRMVSRKGDTKRYPLGFTVTRLGWLAREMRKHDQTIFFLGQLQSNWLHKWQRTLFRWSAGLVTGLVTGLVAGLGFGLVVWLVVGPLFGSVFGSFSWLFFVLLAGLITGLNVGVHFGEFFESRVQASRHENILANLAVRGKAWDQQAAFEEKELEEELVRTFPPTSVWEEVRFGLRFGPLFGLVAWGAILVAVEPVAGLVAGLIVGLVAGLIVGLVYGLLCGLGAIVQHYILRFWLWRTHALPWKAVPFLDDATARIQLRRVGGGYQFTHRLLLDYFADLDAHPSLPSTAESSTLSPTP
jgi:NACHT domain-containing protein